MKQNPAEDPTTRSRLRILQYQHIDGTFELTYGGAALLMAASFYASSLVTISGTFISTNLLPFAPLAAFVGGVYLFDALVRRFKSRVTYLRTGYIAYQPPRPLKQPARLVIWIGVPVLTAVLLLLLILNRSKFQAQGGSFELVLVPFFGILLTALWIVMGWKIGLPRFFLVAAVSLLACGWVFLNGVDQNTSMAMLLGSMGLALCVSGGVTLRQYLHNNPVPKGNSSDQ